MGISSRPRRRLVPQRRRRVLTSRATAAHQPLACNAVAVDRQRIALGASYALIFVAFGLAIPLADDAGLLMVPFGLAVLPLLVFVVIRHPAAALGLFTGLQFMEAFEVQ